ncbi:MAG TPA: hypothetical protein PK014_11485 [Thermoanaerobaculia bacterium]|nr:hypothetical protein [Thermoanaerobaculia bacterium]HUM30721.1 hypothetical protein [Thermoanaerobaculia bacterium]
MTGTVSHWDFMLHWAAKSRQYYLGHLFDPQYLLWPWHHHLKPDYPHLVTNLFTFQALMMSQFNDRLMMLNDVIFVAALFYVVFILIRKIVYQWYVSFMVFLGFSLLFVSFVINTRTVGGADLLFSSLAGCVVYYFHEYGERRQYSALRNMFIFLGILSYTKFEGLFYSALFSVMIAICLFVKKQHFKMMLRSLLWYGCIVAPWLAVTTYFHLNTQASAGSAILSRIGLLPALLQGFLETLLQPTWYGAWIFFATSYAYILVFRKRVGLLPITLLLLCIYLVIYLTNSDPIYYLQSSLGRLLLPLFVLCVYDFISAFRVRTAA